jgi:hypothetical protein
VHSVRRDGWYIPLFLTQFVLIEIWLLLRLAETLLLAGVSVLAGEGVEDLAIFTDMLCLSCIIL